MATQETGLVTVATFRNYIEANIAKTKLESEGIRAFLAGDTIVTLNPLYSVAFGWIKLQVGPGDSDKARAILDQEWAPPEPPVADAAEPPSCPECGASDAYAYRFDRHLAYRLWAILAVIGMAGGITELWPFAFVFNFGLAAIIAGAIAGVIALFAGPQWLCGNCGYHWKD